MKTKTILIATMSLFVTACHNDSLVSLEIDDQDITFKESIGIQHDIYVNIISSRYRMYKKGEKNTRSSNNFFLTPNIVDGNTTAFIVQYKDGWEIYSANKSINMILYSSEYGKFEIEDPNLPISLKFLIKENLNAIAAFPNTDFVNPTWGRRQLRKKI